MWEWLMMKMRKIEILLLIVVSYLCLYFAHAYYKRPSEPLQIANTDTLVITHTDTLIIRDTITKVRPLPRRVDTVYVDTVQHIRKAYEIDSSDYKVHITTDNFDVDSVRVMMKYSIYTNNRTLIKTNTIYKKKHFNWGIQAGVGYGLITRSPDVYVGVGLQYNF